MAIRRKLALINGAIDQEGSILIYQTVNSFEIGCFPTSLGVPPCPFPMTMTIGTILIRLSKLSLF